MRGLGLPGWRLRRDGADFDEAEAHRGEGVDAAGVLVEPGGQAHAVGKGQPGERDRVVDAHCGIGAGQRRVLGARQPVQREFVGVLGVETEQERAGQAVERRRASAGASDNSRLQ
jgi:hypothetical protein